MTPVVEQLLQVLVADDRSGLAGPPPRHAPPPSFMSLEQEIARRFPALAQVAYPAVLQALYAHVLPGLDCGIMRFQASPPDAPLGELRALVFDSWEPEAIAGQGLLAIANDGNEAVRCAWTAEAVGRPRAGQWCSATMAGGLLGESCYRSGRSLQAAPVGRRTDR